MRPLLSSFCAIALIMLVGFTSKEPIEEYKNNDKSVVISLKLYADSTYEYSEWMHLGNFWKDKGKYLKNDSTIVLESVETRYNPNTRKKRSKESSTAAIFKRDTFKISSGAIFLYRTESSQAFRVLRKV